MRTSRSHTRLLTTLLGAMGLSGTAACGGKVVFDEGTGGAGTTGVGNTAAPSATHAASTGTGASVCAGAMPVLLDGKDSGYVRCADGAVDRVTPLACDPTVNLAKCQGTEQNIQCTQDTDCNASPNGHCVHSDDINLSGTSCGCVYACSSDADCDTGPCACAGLATGLSTSQCTAYNCHDGADCPSGECGISSYNNGCSQVIALACRSAADKCRSDATCMQSACAPPLSTGMPYDCQKPTCAVGRPLVVDGTGRVARNALRSDWHLADWQVAETPIADSRSTEWRVEVTDLASTLDAPTRALVARHYAEVAAMEHASIASFARFSLQLLLLGAPSDLVLEAQRAGLDEIEHARIGYALASLYGGETIGPSALPAAVAPIESDVVEIVRALVFEGCVGETLGAAEALAIAADASPSIAAIHRLVGTDEERHAALAWRTLAWLVSGDPQLRSVARDAFDRATTHYEAVPNGLSFSLGDHGVLSARAISAHRRRCLVEVIAPCARALLE